MKVIETGPIRAVVQVKKSFGDSAFVENIVLYSHADRVDFELGVDWHEKYRFAKVAFPLNLKSVYATYEIPFGAIQRFDYTLKADPGIRMTAPPRAWEIADRTKFEVPGQRWADVSNQAGDYGVTLLNDSKYGFSYAGEYPAHEPDSRSAARLPESCRTPGRTNRMSRSWASITSSTR